MRRSTIMSTAIALSILSLAVLVTPASAVTSSSSGKYLALYADYGNSTVIQSGSFTATILKGKKKKALIIQTTATVFGGGTYACIDEVRVNGLLASPTTGGFNVGCTATSANPNSQTITGIYSFDIDAGESIVPGTFYGQPLNVVVKTNTDTSAFGSISIVVQMQKK